jgi:hypothetical protein
MNDQHKDDLPADLPPADSLRIEPDDLARFRRAEDARRAQQAAQRAEDFARAKRAIEAPRPPLWFTDLEERCGERIACITFADGRTFKPKAGAHFAAGRSKPNWRIAAQLLARGESPMTAAAEAGATMKAMRAKLRRPSMLLRYLAEAVADRGYAHAMRADAFVTGRLDEIAAGRAYDEADLPLRHWLIRHAVQRSAAAAAPKPHGAAAKRIQTVPNRAGIDANRIAPPSEVAESGPFRVRAVLRRG